MADGRITVTLSPEAIEALNQKGENRSAALESIIDRYEELNRRERRDLRNLFSTSECLLLVSVLAHQNHFPTTVIFNLWFLFEDALKDTEVSQKYEVDAQRFLSKIKSLTATQTLALIDAAERFALSAKKHPEETESLASMFLKD